MKYNSVSMFFIGIFVLITFSMLITNCQNDSEIISSGGDPSPLPDGKSIISVQVVSDEVIIQLYEPNQIAKEYYAEITNEEGRRFAVNIGLQDKEGKFRINNYFGKIVKVEISSNLDFE